MLERKTYFVTVDTEEIREVTIPDNGIEYEIEATEDEIKEIEILFKEKKDDAKNAVKYLTKPFDEWGADDERNKFDNHLIKIYRRLYELGTEETKHKINDIGVFH